jgi:hypothetical protein
MPRRGKINVDYRRTNCDSIVPPKYVRWIILLYLATIAYNKGS